MKSIKTVEKQAPNTRHSQVKYLKLETSQKDMQIITKLRERKDHFMVTIYKEERQKLSISIGDIVLFRLGKYELIRMVKKDFHISLPKNILKNKTNSHKIRVHILKITKKENCLERPINLVKNSKLDIRYFIPKKTIFDYPIYIIERGGNYFSVWYSIGGGVRHVNIKNFTNVEKMAELIGFYFGDGSTSKNIRSFRLTNCEPSVLNYCLDVLEGIGINRDAVKAQIIYSTDKELTYNIKNKCAGFWSKTLDVNKNSIVSVSEARNIRETLEYGSARIFIDNAILVEIFLHGLLKKILQRITSPNYRVDKKLLKGFIRGLLAAEGSVNLNKYGSVVKVGISYDPHSDELELYKKLLKNLSITCVGTKGNELYICGFSNIKKFHEMDAFKMHRSRNQKFISGISNHKSLRLIP